MELIWPQTGEWLALQRAIAPVLARATAAGGPGRRLVLSSGAPDGPPSSLTEGGLALRPDLLGPEMYAREDAAWREGTPDPALAALALDRWRRAAGLILEAALLGALADRLHAPLPAVAASWWLRGQVAEQIDALDPELGWLWPAAVDLLRRPERDLRADPGRVAWLVRWLRRQARPLPEQADAPPALSAAEWAAFGAWCRDLAHGPAGQAPLPLPLAPPAASLPDAPEPMSLHPVRWRAPAAGLRLGPQAAPDHLAGDAEEVVVFGSLEGTPWAGQATPGEAAGRWQLVSGEYGQRTGGARGVELALLPDGQVEITLANAFVGPLSGDALSLARQFGASGFGGGRWRVLRLEPSPGQGELILQQISIDHLTIHPRKGLKFALPGQGWLERLQGALARLQGRPMRFAVDGEQMVLSCTIREDAELVLRLQRLSDA